MLAAYQIKHMLNSQGQSATLTVEAIGAYDPLTGTTPAATLTPYSVKAYFASFSLSETDKVVSGSRSVLVGSTDTGGVAIPKPSIGDILEGVNGDTVVVKATQAIYSGDEVACYICEAEE